MFSTTSPTLPAQISPFNSSNGRNVGRERQKNSGDISYTAAVMQEQYRETSLSLEFSSKDGDSVSIQYSSIEYSKSIMAVSASGDRSDMEKLVSMIRDNLEKMHRNFVKSLFSDIPGAGEESARVVKEAEPELQVPDYWSAENTSQRITDFAFSFFHAFEGGSDEYLSVIKNAIDEGFKQAREMMGELPDEVSGLIDDTYALVMQKLDDWGVSQEETPEINSAAAA